jgi:hypothetical protein
MTSNGLLEILHQNIGRFSEINKQIIEITKLKRPKLQYNLLYTLSRNNIELQ